MEFASEENGGTSSKRPRDGSGELGLANSFVLAQESLIVSLEAKKKLLVEQIAALRALVVKLGGFFFLFFLFVCFFLFLQSCWGLGAFDGASKLRGRFCNVWSMILGTSWSRGNWS